MNSRSLRNGCLAVAMLAALAPISTQAATDALTDTCINTFVDRYVPENLRVTDIISKPKRYSGIYDGFRTRHTIRVRARGATTGKTLRSAACVVDRKGDLLAMYVDGAKVSVEPGEYLGKAR